MKKLVFKALGLALLATSVCLTSCDKDDDPVVIEQVIENLKSGEMSGQLTEGLYT